MSSSVVIVVAFLLVFLAEIVADRPGFHVPRGGTGRLPQINVPKLPSASQQVPRVEIPKVDTRPHNIPKIDGPRDNTHSELSRIDTPKVSSENHHRTEISSGSQRTFESGGKHSSLDQNFGRRGGSNEESHRHNFNGNRGNGETHPNANGRENTETSRRTEDSNREDRTRGMDSSHRFDGNTHERSRNSEGHSESGGQRESARNDHKNSHQNRRVLKQHELPGDKDDKESVKHEYMQFRSAHGSHRFLSDAEQGERLRRYEQHRKRVKDHNRLYESGQRSFRIKVHEYSDEDLQTLIKQRNGFKSGHFNVKRLQAAPPVNLSRHRGSLHKFSRAKRQNSLQQLLSLFQTFQSLSNGQLPSFSLPGFSIPGLPGIPGVPVGPVSPGGNGAHKAPVYPTGPDSLDWRLHDYVTPVKDQGVCGSCYTFSALGALEGQMAACHADHTSLSEQNLIDCAGSYGAGACDGGDPAQVFKYAKDHGVEPESAYPYIAKTTSVNHQSCKQNPSLVNPNSWVENYDALPEGDEVSLRNALHVGPISVCISASSPEFQAYSDGVFDFPSCSKNVDHAVLLVGYGTDEKAGDYWVVKNSWGPNWGEDGYIRMKRNANNQCGIASYAIYPNLKGC